MIEHSRGEVSEFLYFRCHSDIKNILMSGGKTSSLPI